MSIKLFCDKEMNVCLRFCDNAVLLPLSGEMHSAGATVINVGSALAAPTLCTYLCYFYPLIATTCGLCAKIKTFV